MTQTGITLIDQLRSVVAEAIGRRPETATVSAIGLNRISARLSSNSTIISNIPVLGGPGGLQVGDMVYLLWFSDNPLALSTKTSGNSAPVYLSSGVGGAQVAPIVIPDSLSGGVTLDQVQALITAANHAPLVHEHGSSWIGATSGSIGGCTIANEGIASNNFVSGSAGWSINGAGDAEFENVKVRGELSSTVFSGGEMQAMAGTWGVYKSASTLYADTVITSGSSNYVQAKNSLLGVEPFAVNDILRLKNSFFDNWVTINGHDTTSGSGLYTIYQCTLNSGSGATYRAGEAIIDYGVSGQGFFAVSADGTLGVGAAWVLGSHSGSPWSAWNATNGPVKQVYAGSDGKLYAGSGNVSLSTAGISFKSDGGSYIGWGTDPTIPDAGYGYISNSEVGTVGMNIMSGAPGRYGTTTGLTVIPSSRKVSVYGDLSVDGTPGSGASPAIGHIGYSGDLKPSRGGIAYPGYIYVPVTVGLSEEHSVLAGAALNIGTYEVGPHGNGNGTTTFGFNYPANAKAVCVQLWAAWAAASNNTAAHCQSTGSGITGFVAIVRSMVANIYNCAFGIVPLDSNGKFSLQVENANSTVLRLYITGYFI